MNFFMKDIFYFGEKLPDYSMRVLNEREARAAAGILFFFSMFSLLNVLLVGNFFPLKIFVLVFVFDFIIRLFVNPKYAPTMIIGRFAVSAQKPEYTGAIQKKFAWSMGLVLALFMLVTVVFPLFYSSIVCWVCMLCVILLFFESSFGICLGCKMYNLFHPGKAELCPGGICEIRKKEDIQRIKLEQVVIVGIFLALVFSLIVFGRNMLNSPKTNSFNDSFCPIGINDINEGSCALLGGTGLNNGNNLRSCPKLLFR